MSEEEAIGAGVRARDTQRSPDGIAAAGVVIYECLLPALPRSVSRIRHELTSVLERYGVADTRCEDIALVLSEAATNAVLHAYPDPNSGPLYVAGTLQRDALTVSVCDCGRGLTLNAERTGLSAGLVLMMRLVDHLEICSDASVDGTCVHATFDRAAAVTAIPAGHDQAAGAARDRGAMLREYLRVLAATHAGLAEDTQAVLAQAQHALARSRRLRQQRSRSADRGPSTA